MLLKRLALVLMLVAAVACDKKKDDATTEETPVDSTPAADGTQTMAALAGDGQFCEVLTTLGGTYSVVRYFKLNADGTYNYSLFMYDASSCSTGMNSSGNNYATYNQSGTYALNGAASISNTGTKVTFTPTSQSMVIRAATYSTPGNALIAWINVCSYSPGYSASTDATKTLNQHVCTTSGSFAAVDFPVNGATYTNVVYKTGTALQTGIPSGATPFTPAGTSYPTTFTRTYAGW